MRQLSRHSVLFIVAVASAAPAAAQSGSDRRVEISVNAGVNTGASTFTAANTRPSNGGENETITVDHDVKTAAAFSVGAAVRLLPRFWAGVHYAMSDMKPGAAITADIPHPILFGAPRRVEGSVDDLAHNQRSVHVALMYALPLHAVDVKILGGPTFFTLKQDFVTDVVVNETYPFDTAAFASATTKELSETAVGFNAGVDISRPLSSKVGLGALIRYSRADVKFDDPDTGRQTAKAGGLEAMGGLRWRF